MVVWFATAAFAFLVQYSYFSDPGWHFLALIVYILAFSASFCMACSSSFPTERVYRCETVGVTDIDDDAKGPARSSLSIFILLMVRCNKADVRSVISGTWDSLSESFAGSSGNDDEHMPAILPTRVVGRIESSCVNLSGSILIRSDGPWKEDISDSKRTHNVFMRPSETDVFDKVSLNEMDSPSSETSTDICSISDDGKRRESAADLLSDESNLMTPCTR